MRRAHTARSASPEAAILTPNPLALDAVIAPPAEHLVASEMFLWLLALAAGTSAARFPSRVLVAGASGRVGTRVVRTLLERTNTTVVALSRSAESKDKIMAFISASGPALRASARLEVVSCDLRNEKELRKIASTCGTAIWCATGFTDGSSPLNKVKGLWALYFGRSVDLDGMATLGKCMREAKGPGQEACVDVVMCSSAGVTRTTWPESKAKLFPGAADIPIVRLNPFGILDQKRKSEEVLRSTGCRYAIVRPTGLNDMWPSGRTVMSQGDVAVGRINRDDVAELLCALVAEPSAVGKTFEAMGVPSYPKLRSLSSVFDRLKSDAQLAQTGGTLSDAELGAEYSLLQQLLPGETGDAAALAMGQTYEQLDVGEQGRFGARGEEKAPLTPVS